MDIDARPSWTAFDEDDRPIVRDITPLLLTPEQAAACLGVCRTKVYQLMTTGRLESVRIGTSRRIAVAALDEFVERLRTSAA